MPAADLSSPVRTTPVWDASPIPQGADEAWVDCGDLKVQCRQSDSEIQLAVMGDSPDELNWNRWTIPNSRNEFHLKPVLPDHSVVFEPESKFFVVPGSATWIFIQIPIWVAFHSGKHLLAEHPTEILSQTWFGELDNGELCYWISTPAHLTPSVAGQENYAIAPVLIENDADENLEVSRICLRTAGLRLYLKGDQLWTSQTQLKYQGGVANSRVKIKDGPPPEARGAKRVSDARDGKGPGIVGRTFRSLRQWTYDVLIDLD